MSSGAGSRSVELFGLWREWFHGGSVQAADLWGATVLVWGRLGKALEFLAGLVVIVDLLDPAKLRHRGALARRRLDERRHRAAAQRRIFELDYLQTRLADSIVHGENDGDGGVVHEVNRHPSGDFGPYAPFTAEAYQALRTDILAALPTAHACGRDHGEQVCAEQQTYVWQRVDAFLTPHWSEEDRQHIAQARRTRDRAGGFWLMAMLVAIGLLLVARVSTVVTIAGVAVCSAVAVLALIPEGWRLSTPRLWVRAHPAAVAGSLLAGLLDRARPLHVLRKVALILFVVGFHFDLLAS